MSKHIIKPGKSEDIEGLVLRDSDLEELKACCSQSPEEQLKETWESSDMRWTIWAGGKVAGVFGCKGQVGKFGVPWMLGSKLTEKIRKVFIVDAKDYVEIMLERYKFLINYVHVDNKQSIRWLKWIGYTVKDPQPFGEFGNLFHPFFRKRNV
jgi:hypothetical protein